MNTASSINENPHPIPPFVYQPLHAEREVRVLVLHPATSFNEPLEAHLETRPLPRSYGDMVTLKDLPEPYEAVSYVWGAADRTFDLICDGQLLKVTRSVDTLLRYLREERKSRRLWVDAVCINQDDGVEKGPQIALMDRIYGRAVEVHAWLGEAAAEDDIPRLFACIVNLVCVDNHAKKKREEWENDPFEEDEYPEDELYELQEAENQDGWGDESEGCVPDRHQKDERSEIKEEYSSKSTGLLKLIRPHADLFDLMLSRPWFRRRWILQEIVLAQNITVRCGVNTLSWLWFEKGLEIYQRIVPGLHSKMQQESLNSLYTMVHLTQNKYSILELLWKCHASACKEPRDRIVALLSMVQNVLPLHTVYGIAPPNEAELIDKKLALSYSESWIDLYASLARLYMAQGHFLDIVQHIYAFGSLCEQDTSWPSWIPCWHLERSLQNQLKGIVPRHSRAYRNPEMRSTTWPSLFFAGVWHKDRVLYKPNWTSSRGDNLPALAGSKTMHRLYSLWSRQSDLRFQSYSPRSEAARAMQLGKMALDAACFSDASITQCVREWDRGNPYQDLNIIAQDMCNTYHKGTIKLEEDDSPVADSRLTRSQLYRALERFQLACFTRNDKAAIPFLVPATIEPEDFIFQVEQWKEVFILLRPVFLAKVGPVYRFVGVCWTCDQDDKTVNAWELLSESDTHLTLLEARRTVDGVTIV